MSAGRLHPRPADALKVDEPETGDKVTGALRVRGWAIAGGRPAVPGVRIDDERAEARLWPTYRPDVAAHLDQDPKLEWGYDGWIDTSGLSLGRHTITISTPSMKLERIVERVEGGTEVVIDRPRGAHPHAGRVAIGGWAQGWADHISNVDVYGHRVEAHALIGLVRPDVATTRGAPLGCGFEAFADIPYGLGPAIPLAVVASDRSGGRSVVFIDALISPHNESRLVVERAERERGRLEVSGYVVWGVPAPEAARASLSVGGEHVAAATASLSRPDLFWDHDALHSSTRCGFRLATADRLGEGPQAATVTVLAQDGRVVTAEINLPAARDRVADLAGALTALRSAAQPGSVVLDCTGAVAGLGLDREFQIVTPLLDQDRLPYADSSFPVVIAPERRGELVADAERVARDALLVIGASEPELRRLSPSPARPSLTVVMPVYGVPDLTDAAIGAVLDSLPVDLDLELIAVDDASPDGAAERLRAWAERDARVKPLILEENVGFLRAANAGCAQASGEIIVLLNNDAIVERGALAALADVLAAFPKAGAAGGKLLYPDGRLQEAGGVLFRDGSAWLVGMRSWQPETPLFDFVRPVDYCSGALFAIRRELWVELGGFDEAYAPAYYEDTDLCMRLRELGRPVLYQPMARAIHHLSPTSGRSGIERGQRVFLERWGERLAAHSEMPEHENLSSWRRLVQESMERAGQWRVP